MVALGRPPSRPNYNDLVDKGVDAAVDLAAEQIAEQTGIPCEGPCRTALHDGFASVADNLKKTTYAPGCVGTEEAHARGREPLCLPDQVIAKPAPGAVYTAPAVVVRVTRNSKEKDPNSLFKDKCRLGVAILFKNKFTGGTVWGPVHNTEDVPSQPINGSLYEGVSLTLPVNMAKGSSVTLPFSFDHSQKYEFAWTRRLWSASQIVARDEAGPMGPDWFTLYSGGSAEVTATINCSAASHTLTIPLPKL
jgi:hypothetical protein